MLLPVLCVCGVVVVRRVANAAGGHGTRVVQTTGHKLFEKKYSKKLHRAMFNELLRRQIADVTELISFPGFDRNYDPVLEQFVGNCALQSIDAHWRCSGGSGGGGGGCSGVVVRGHGYGGVVTLRHSNW